MMLVGLVAHGGGWTFRGIWEIIMIAGKYRVMGSDHNDFSTLEQAYAYCQKWFRIGQEGGHLAGFNR